MGIYLDHAATTNIDKQVLAAMQPFFDAYFGNASSQHGFGRIAQKALMTARE